MKFADAQRGSQGSRTYQYPHLDLEQLINFPLPGPGIDGKPAVWSLAALAFTGILDTFVEPDRNYSPAPLSRPPASPSAARLRRGRRRAVEKRSPACA